MSEKLNNVTDPIKIDPLKGPDPGSDVLLITIANPDRAHWGRPLEFVLACVNYAVGLGNVWRFPYLCYRNGGGAFLVPFFLMSFGIGLPLFFLELYIGQYTGLGPINAFVAIAPFYSGLGYCTLVVISIVNIYYMVIVAWILFYLFVSIGGNMAWGSCVNKFNTDYCYSGKYDRHCRENNTGAASDLTYYLRKCLSIGQICTNNGFQPHNGTHCLNGTIYIPWYTNVTRTIAAEDYFNEYVLGRGQSSWEHWGYVQWHLVGCLGLSWFLTFACVLKGIQSAGKIGYFTVLFPYVMLTILFIRGLTLDGAMDGISFLLAPRWEILKSGRVWGDAASQVFYSFGLGCGSLVTLASYNKYSNNCQFDAVFVSLTNIFTSMYAGFAIFSVLGFQAQLMEVTIDNVAEQGPGLAFVAYPEALLQMPVSRLWSILFFSMLFILGLGCQFAGVESMNTAVVDRWPHLRKHYWRVTAGTCSAFFILGVPMCFSGGVYLHTLLDWNTASWAILLIGTAEVSAMIAGIESLSVGWSYGINKAIRDLDDMKIPLNKLQRIYWKVSWTLIVPIACIGILIFIFHEWEDMSYENYKFPVFAITLGWAVGLSTLMFFPVGVAWAYFKGYKGKRMFTPTSAWKPNKI